MPDRISWRQAHRDWQAADAAFKAKHGEEYWKLFRHQLMPTQLSGRVERMLKRIAENATLVSNRERHMGVAWIQRDMGLSRARWQLADSIRTLRRHVRRPVTHPKGGLQGRPEEFSPMLRKFLRGNITRDGFLSRARWALRLLEEIANPRAGHQSGHVKIERTG
jgi:hypothetical protein